MPNVSAAEIQVGHAVKFFSKVRRCQTIETAEDECSQFKLDPLRNLQPVQVTKKWCDVVVFPRGKPVWWQHSARTAADSKYVSK